MDINAKTLAGFARIVGIMSPQIVEKVCRFHFSGLLLGITHELRKEIMFWIIPRTKKSGLTKP